MPFDGSHFEPTPTPPRKANRAETALIVLLAVLAVGAAVLPISLLAVGDLAAYLLGRR